jgi:hypothetical protein
MNALLWVLQTLLAFHTAIGAFWKFSNSPQTVPSLTAIPHGSWHAMSVIELLCAVGFVVPALNKSLGPVAPIAAVGIATEMLAFSAFHFQSGETDYAHVVYWLVVAGVSGFIAYGRFVLKPL